MSKIVAKTNAERSGNSGSGSKRTGAAGAFKPKKKIDATASWENLDNLRQTQKELQHAAAYDRIANMGAGNTGGLGVGVSKTKTEAPKPTKSQITAIGRQIGHVMDKENERYIVDYAGSDKTKIDAAMKSLEKDKTERGKREYNWLRQNQYNYWTTSELKQGIKNAEKATQDYRKSTSNVNPATAGAYQMNTGANAAAFQSARKKRKENAEASANVEAMRRVLTDKLYGEQLAKLTAEEEAALMAYGKANRQSQDSAVAAAFSSLNSGGMDFAGQSLSAARDKERNEQAAKVAGMLKRKGFKPEEIDALLDYSTRVYNAQVVQETADLIRNSNGWEKAAASVASVPMNLAGGVAGALDAALQRMTARTDPFTGQRQSIDYNSRGQMLGNTASTIRGTISEGMSAPEAFFYNTGMSILDFVAAAPTGAGAEILLGASAAQNAMQDAHKRGATDDQALLLGLAAGVAEALFEHVSLDKLKAFQTAKKGIRLSGDEILEAFAKQGITEGSEEGATTLANTLTDLLIMADKNQIAQTKRAYMAQGMSESDATRAAWEDQTKQLLSDMAGGFISGGVMIGGSSAIHKGGEFFADAGTGMNIGGSRSPAALADVEQGLLFPEASQTHKQAVSIAKTLAQGKTPTGHAVGKLHNLMLEDQLLGYEAAEDRGGVGRLELLTTPDGKKTMAFVQGPITYAFQQTGLNAQDSILRAKVLQAMIDGDEVSGNQLKDQLKIFSPETKKVFADLTGTSVPDLKKTQDMMQFYRTVMDEFRAGRDAVMAETVEQETQPQEQEVSPQDQAQENPETDLGYALESEPTYANLPQPVVAPESDAAYADAERVEGQYVPAETREQFEERYIREQQEKRNITPKPEQVEKAWRRLTDKDGILLSNGEYVGREEFYREMRENLSTDPDDPIDLDDDQLEEMYLAERHDSRVTPVPAADWGRTETKTSAEEAPAEEVPAEEAPVEEAPVETQAEEEPAATVLSVQEETPAPSEAAATEAPAAEETAQKPKKTAAKKTVIPTKAEAEASRNESATVTKVTEKKTESKTEKKTEKSPIPTKAEVEEAKVELKAAVTMPVEGRNVDALERGINSGELTMEAVNLVSKRTGFSDYQREHIARTLIENAVPQDEITEKTEPIRIDIPGDGKLTLLNNPEAVAKYLDRLGVKVNQRSAISKALAAHLKKLGKKATPFVLTTKDGGTYVATNNMTIVPVGPAAVEQLVKPLTEGGYGASQDSANPTVEKLPGATYTLIEEAPTSYKRGRETFYVFNVGGQEVMVPKADMSYLDGALLYGAQIEGQLYAVKAVNPDGTVRGYVAATARDNFPKNREPTKLKSFSKTMQSEIAKAQKQSGPEQKATKPKTKKSSGEKSSIGTRPTIPSKEQAVKAKSDFEKYGGLAAPDKKVSLQMQAAVEMMRKLLKPLGIKSIIFDSESLGPTRNASIKDGVIRLNEKRLPNASLIYWAIGHELTHPSSDTDPTLAKEIVDTISELAKSGAFEGELADLILDELKDPEGAIKSRAADYTMEYLRDGRSDDEVKKLTTDDEMRVEVAGDWMGYVLASQPVLERLAGVKPDLLTRILRAIDRFKGVEVNQLVKNGKGYRQTMKTLDGLVDRVHAALEKSAGEKTNIGEKYSATAPKINSDGEKLTADQSSFFADSAVRNKDGELLVLYHGSRSEAFTEFDLYEGVWLTPDQRYAEVYATDWHNWRDDFEDSAPRGDLNGLEPDIYADPDLRVYKMYANITNPLDLGEIDGGLSDSKVRQLARALGVPYATMKPIADQFVDEYTYQMTRDHDFIELAKAQGFDGFKATESGKESWCAFQAQDQVKLTANKNPTTNPDVRYSATAPKLPGQESAVYIPNTVNNKTGEEISFVDLILDGKKTGETRPARGYIPVGKWVGLTSGGKNPKIVGRVVFGEPYEITKESPEYKTSFIQDTEYDLGDGETKLYYPVEQYEDFRDNPITPDKLGQRPVYQYNGTRYSATAPILPANRAEMDRKYMDAVESDDMETAQAMVDEAARQAGYGTKAYHGTRSDDFTVFDMSRIGDNYDGFNAEGGAFNFTKDEDWARRWGGKAKGNGPVRVIPAYLKAEKTFYSYDGAVDPALRAELPENMPEEKKDAAMLYGAAFHKALDEAGINFREAIRRHGYDSYAQYPSADNIAVYSAEQIKSADPVTYDRDGNIIPLSERFRTDRTGEDAWKNDDIRYSAVGPVTGFYNLSERVLADVKNNKFDASTVVKMLRGKGVKAEEIKWIGIEDFLKGKKSVTKQELLDWIAANDLVIEEETLGPSSGYFADVNTGKTYSTREEAYQAAVERARAEGFDAEDVRLSTRYGDVYYYLQDPRTNTGRVLLQRLVPEGADETHWSGYATPGGDNYREILFRLPNSDYSNGASEAHWEEKAPGVVAHVRVQDFTDNDGRSVLFIDEIQSDWHNAGHKYGYKSQKPAGESINAQVKEKQRQFEHLVNEELDAAEFNLTSVNADLHDFMSGPARDVLTKLMPMWGRMYSSQQRASIASAARNDDLQEIFVPANEQYGTQFSEDDEAVLRELLDLEKERQAAEAETERINAEIDRIKEELRLLKRGQLFAAPDAPFAENYTEFVLKRLLREAAEKGYDGIAWTDSEMQMDRWNPTRELNDKGVPKFQEAYRNIYDRQAVKDLNKLGKKFGAKVGTTELDSDGETITVPFFPVTEEMKAAVLENGMPKFSVRGENPAFDAYVDKLMERQRQRYLKENPPVERPSQTNSTTPMFTPEEKEMPDIRQEDRKHIEVKDPAMAQMASMRLDADYDGEKQRLYGGDYQKWDAADLATAESILKQEIEKARETGDYSEVRRMVRMHDHQMSDWGLAGHTARNFGHSFAGIVTEATDILDKAVEREPANQGKRNKARKVAEGVSQAGKDALNTVRREIEQASNETPGARPSNRRGGTDANGRPVIPSKETVERNKQNRGKTNAQEQEGEGNQGRNMINEPFTFEYADAVGTAIGNSIMKRDEQSEKAKTFLQELQSHIMRYVTEKLPKRKTKKPMTPTELLREYVQNRSFYDRAWTLAQDEVRRQLEKKGIEETPEELKEFLEGWYNIDSTGTPQGKLLRAAITHAALASNETAAKIRERAAVGVDVAEEIANDLIRETGAKGDIALTIRQAAGLYVDDVLARGVKNNNAAGNGAVARTAALDKMVNSALREIGHAIDENTGPKSMSKLGATSAASKAVIRDSVIRTLMNKYAVSQADAENVANIIGKRFDALLQEGMQKRLESLFKEKNRPDKTKQQSFLDRVIELTNLGALDSKDYHDAAVAKLLDGYTTRRGTTVDEVLKKVYDYADRLDRIPEGDVTGLKDIITKLNAERWTGGMIKGNEIHKTLRKAIDKIGAEPGGERFLRQLAAAQIRGIANDNAQLTVVDAITAERYLAMLSKLTTVARNIIGNTAFDLVETISNNTAATPIDVLMSVRTNRRTTTIDKSWLSEEKRRGAIDGLIRSYIELALDAPIEDGTGKWEMRNGRTFKMAKPDNPNALKATTNFAERLMSTWEKWQKYLLVATDEFAKGGTRAERQRQIDYLKSKGKLEADALMDDANEVARERTFQNQGAMTTITGGLRGIGNVVGVRDSHGKKVGLGTAFMPFANVPANIIGQALNYSPLGLIKGIGEVTSVMAKGKNATAEQQAKAARDFGRGANGTALIGLFMAAALKGLLTVGGGSGDKDEDALKRDEGLNGVQLNLSALARWAKGESTERRKGDDLINLSGFEPMNGAMTFGAMLADSYDEDGSLSSKIANSSLKGALQLVMGLPSLSQISSFVNAYKYSDERKTEDNPNGGEAKQFMDATAQSLADIATSGVPNALSGIAQAMDKGRVRSMQTSDKRGLEAIPENTLNAFKAKIPGLRDDLPQALDSYGKPRQTTASPLQNALNSNILPYAINSFQPNPVSEELLRLRETGAKVTMPSRSPIKTVDTANGDNKKLTESERREYQQATGDAIFKAMSEALGKSEYDRMPDETKAEVWSGIKSYATAKGKQDVGGKSEDPDWYDNYPGSTADKAIANAWWKTARTNAALDSNPTQAEVIDAITKAGLSDSMTQTLINGHLSEAGIEKYNGAKAIGLNPSTYINLLEATSQEKMPADKKDDGKSISGSRKKKVVAYLSNLVQQGQLTQAQADFIIHDVYGWK